MHFHVIDNGSDLSAVNSLQENNSLLHQTLLAEFNISSVTKAILGYTCVFLTVDEHRKFAATSKKIKVDAYSAHFYTSCQTKNLPSLRDFLSNNRNLVSLSVSVLPDEDASPPTEETKSLAEEKISLSNNRNFVLPDEDASPPTEATKSSEEKIFPSNDFNLLREFFPKIFELQLSCRFPDVDWFASIPKLRELALFNCETDISVGGKFPNLENLILQNYTASFSFEMLRDVPLKALGLDNCPEIDLSQLTDLVHLTHLTICNIYGIQIPSFKGCHNLKVIDLINVVPTGFEPLHELESLEEFRLDTNTSEDDPFINITFLQDCHKLRVLSLSGIDVVDVIPLGTCLSLEELPLTEIGELVDISPIMGLPIIRKITIHSGDLDTTNLYNFPSTLTCLNLFGSVFGGNISFGFSSKLKEIILDFKKYKNGLAFLDLPSLRESLMSLSLASYVLSEEKDVQTLASLTKLETLFLGGVTDTNIRLFSNLTKLERVHIWDSAISNLNGLKNCVNIWGLFLTDNNHLSNIKVVKNFPLLEKVEFKNCPRITDVDILSVCPKLRSIKLEDCGIESLAPFSNCLNLQNLEINSPIIGIAELIAHSTLETLFLNNCCRLTNLDPLKLCPNLREICFLCCNDLDFSPLVHCAKLEKITLKIPVGSDITVLRTCGKFRKIITALIIRMIFICIILYHKPAYTHYNNSLL